MLQLIKQRCYITSNIYDDEIQSLISAGKIDCIQSGVSEKVFEKSKDGKYDDQVLNCITAFVKAHRGNDRSDTEMYMKMYESIRNKMTQESEYTETGGDTNE